MSVMRLRNTAFLAGILLCVSSLFSTGHAARWNDVTAQTIGTTAEWSNKVELADIDADGDVDILFANGGNYSTAGTAEKNRVFQNQGNGTFVEITTDVFGSVGDLARVVKVRDINQDGWPDIFVGTTYHTQSRLYLGSPTGFSEVTVSHLPAARLSVGDAEFGDVDGNGTLDLMLIDWGNGDPFDVTGHPVLWLGDGTGHFAEASSSLPDVGVGFSWDLELVDVDNDFDLDTLISCKVCDGSFLLRNDGQGTFSDASQDLPQFSNNYDFEPMDVNGDGFVDLVTINDGPNIKEHIFTADGKGGYDDATTELWPGIANPPADDNVIAFLDFDSDGDSDFLIGSLSSDDRLLVNDGTGHLTLEDNIFSGTGTPGTLGLAVADLNGDGKLDVVQSQGEVAFADKVYFGDDVAVDKTPPHIPTFAYEIDGGTLRVRARIHDGKSPTQAFDWQSVTLSVSTGSMTEDVAMIWYGEALWRAQLEAPGASSFVICATDRMGLTSCTEPQSLQASGDSESADGRASSDAGLASGDAMSPSKTDPGSGCGCNAESGLPALANAVMLLAFLFLARYLTRKTAI